MNQNMWRDLILNFTDGIANAAVTTDPMTNNASGFMANHSGWLSHLNDNTMTFMFQRPHMWATGTQIQWHVHYMVGVNPAVTQNVRLQVAYIFINDGDTLPDMGADFAGWGGVHNVDIPIHPGDAMKILYHNGVNAIPPSDPNPCDFLIMAMRRNGTDNANDTYTTNKPWGNGAANFCVMSMDLHYQADKMGTIQPYA